MWSGRDSQESLNSALVDIDPGRGQHGTWFVEFIVNNVTKEELGWHTSSNVDFGAGDSYNLLDIEIDPTTGKVTLKKATNGQLIVGPGLWVDCAALPQNAVEVISIQGPIAPIQSGGPMVELILKNISDRSFINLRATLILGEGELFNFDFNVSELYPLTPGMNAIADQTLIAGGFANTSLYTLVIYGTFEDGLGFKYVEQIQIALP